MSQPENTVEVQWGGLLVGDVQVAPDGREWRVSAIKRPPRDPWQITLTREGESDAVGAPPYTGTTFMRPRAQVSVREAVETIAQTFPDTTVDAHLRDPSTCDRCGTAVRDELVHEEWHKDVDNQTSMVNETIGAILARLP